MSVHFYPAPTPIAKPRLSLCWRDEEGTPHASVNLGEDFRAHITVTDPAEARELAGQIIAAAMWLEVAQAETAAGLLEEAAGPSPLAVKAAPWGGALND